MKRLIPWPKVSNNQLSLFYTLLCSFIAIILLLVSIHLAAYSFFRDRIKEEIIVNSGLNLNTTVTNYEKHFKLMRSFMLGYLFDNDTQIMKSGNNALHYDIVTRVQKELQNTMNNSLFYLDNIIYFFKDTGFVFDRDGTRNAETMFSKFYVSEPYTADFWKRQVETVESFKVYPASVFRMDTLFEQSSYGSLMPIMIKSAYDDRLAFILLLKSAKAYEAFHQPKPGSSLLILDSERDILFASSPTATLPESLLAAGQAELQGSGYMKEGDTFYFYRAGPETGFTYVEAVADRGLTEQLRNLNRLMFALLGLSILISLTVSYVIARKFHNPLAKLIRSVQTYSVLGGPGAASSRIKEFNVLHSTLRDLSRSNEQFHQDLQAKNTMLQQFAYMSKLKKIGGAAGLETALDEDKPYRLVLFQLEFKDRFLHEISSSPHRAFNTYKELIDAHFSSRYSESLTFQLEKDQILTILFLNDDEARSQDADIRTLIRIFDMDTPYCNFTIAPSPVRKHAADFAETYQNALDLIQQRKLGEDVQIITEWRPHPSLLVPTPSEETELVANLQAGADSVTVPLVEKLLDQLDKAGALASQFQDFAKDIVNRTIKAMYAQNVSVGSVIDGGALHEQLKACHTLEQYKTFFRRFLTRSATAIQEKKSETDPITKFVFDYVEANFGGDLSLDAIAYKLGITGPYLSSYFKEKTGTNFSDYIYTVRMNKATEMLIETDMLIQEIASLVGYFTVASFNRVFKRYTGMTPSEFRRQNKKWEE